MIEQTMTKNVGTEGARMTLIIGFPEGQDSMSLEDLGDMWETFEAFHRA